MQEKTKLTLMLYFTICYLSIFTVIALLNSNYEFLYYTAVMSILILILIKYYNKMQLTVPIAFGLTLVTFLHILGGNIHIYGVRLYDVWLIKPYIFRFDNLVHLVGSFVAALFCYSLVYPHLQEETRKKKAISIIIVILMACGIGALNEVLELGAVVWFNASAQVGDYLNNALDLLFNLCGAILAAIYLFYFKLE